MALEEQGPHLKWQWSHRCPHEKVLSDSQQMKNVHLIRLADNIQQRMHTFQKKLQSFVDICKTCFPTNETIVINTKLLLTNVNLEWQGQHAKRQWIYR